MTDTLAAEAACGAVEIARFIVVARFIVFRLLYFLKLLKEIAGLATFAITAASDFVVVSSNRQLFGFEGSLGVLDVERQFWRNLLQELLNN
jgi:hypothetical protein